MNMINLGAFEIACVAVFWLIVIYRWSRRPGKRLPTVSASQTYELDNPPLVSIIVPARNEEDCIGTCIKSLLAQDYPRFEIIAVDDRSDDLTGAILDSLAETDDRLTVIHGKKIPHNWTGKMYAITQAYKKARGEWLVFTDADTEHDRCLLSGVMALVSKNRVAFATVLGSLRYPTLGAFIASIAVVAYIFLFLDSRRRKNQKSRSSMLIGHYVIFSRHAYDAIGTHTAIRRYSSTDVTLGYLAKMDGWTSLLIDGQSTLKITPYRSFSDAFFGWSRAMVNGSWSFFGKLLGSLFLILATGILSVFWIAPWIGFWWNLFAVDIASVIANCLQILAGLAVILLARPGLRTAILDVLVMPLSMLLFVAMICTALPAALTRGGTRWKGRVVKTGIHLPAWKPGPTRSRYPGPPTSS